MCVWNSQLQLQLQEEENIMKPKWKAKTLDSYLFAIIESGTGTIDRKWMKTPVSYNLAFDISILFSACIQICRIN